MYRIWYDFQKYSNFMLLKTISEKFIVIILKISFTISILTYPSIQAHAYSYICQLVVWFMSMSSILTAFFLLKPKKKLMPCQLSVVITDFFLQRSALFVPELDTVCDCTNIPRSFQYNGFLY